MTALFRLLFRLHLVSYVVSLLSHLLGRLLSCLVSRVLDSRISPPCLPLAFAVYRYIYRRFCAYCFLASHLL